MTFQEATIKKDKVDRYSKLYRVYDKKKQKYCEEVSKKVCAKIRCYDCVRYGKNGCYRNNLTNLDKAELDELTEWAKVKIRTEFPQEVSRDILK